MGVRVGAKEGEALDSPTSSGGDEMRPGVPGFLSFLRLSVVSSFLRAGAPALGLWAGGEEAGRWASAVPADSLGPGLEWPQAPGRLFVITELSARLGAGATHEPGVSPNSLLVSSPQPGPGVLLDPSILSGTRLSHPAGAGTISQEGSSRGSARGSEPSRPSREGTGGEMCLLLPQ